MRTACLIGTRTSAGYGDTVVRVAAGGYPDQMLPTLRQIWRWTFDADTTAFTEGLLAHNWVTLDVAVSVPPGGGTVEPGIGTPATTFDDLVGRRLRTTDSRMTGTVWLYVLDTLDEQVLVFQATADGQWATHSRHRLHADLDATISGPLAVAGDAAAADLVGHHWRPATVSLDGLHTAWTAQICAGEHARGVIVVRFDHDTLAEAIDVLETFYADRLPGSGLPRHHLDGDVLVTTWYTGTPHAQTQITYADRHGRFILGPNVWPWTVTGEHTPASTAALRNGIAPIREWVSPAGFFACHPHLDRYTLPQVCAATADLAGARGVAVIEPVGGGGHVWLVAASHALMITPVSRDDTASTVVLPRPLGGSWTDDQPVPLLTAGQVADACARLYPPSPHSPSR
jgi:hypothetical protein